jgi:hypothetical protein
MGLFSVSVRAEINHSFVVLQARHAIEFLDQMRGVSLPRGGTLFLQGLDEGARYAVAMGDLFRVAYRDPSLRVILANPGEEPPNDLRGAGAVALRVTSAGLEEIGVRAAPALILKSLMPASVSAGERFNVQPDGQSALAVAAEGAGSGVVVVFNSKELPTVYGNPRLVTATIPAELFAQPGVYRVFLRYQGAESNSLDFVVKP